MQISAKELSNKFHGIIEGDENILVHAPAKIEEGFEGAVSFLANKKYEKFLYDSKSSIIFIDKDFDVKQNTSATLIRVDNCYKVFSQILKYFELAKTRSRNGIEEGSYIDKNAIIGQDVYVAAFAYVSKGAKIGNNVKIYPHVYIGDDVVVGDNTVLYSGVKVYTDCQIGNDCILHSNVVVGSDGFGFAPKEDGAYEKIPQTGNVIIKNGVEIGANTAIDRATMGSTVIGDGVKLDNLIQVAHNVEIGKNTVIAAQTGISGSTKINKQCVIAGQVGIVGHITIADGTRIGAQSGISKSVNQPLTILSGTPAMSHKESLKSQAVYKKLPELMGKLRTIEKQIEALNN